MKVLWLVNIMLPAYARKKGLVPSVREGWLTGIYERFAAKQSSERPFELYVCFPGDTDGRREETDGVTFLRFREDLSRPEVYHRGLEKRFRKILDAVDPDLVHIFGTEFPHALAMARAFANPQRTLIGMQGICTEIAKVYRAGLPDAVFSRVTLRDMLRRDSLAQQQEKFRIRGVRERGALLLADHITGRTAFDRTFTGKLVPRARYHHMNETMRPPFYEGRWRPEEARPHSVFVSQGDYPLKGLHFLLRVLPHLARRYPDIRVTVAGTNVMKDRLRTGAYGEYLRYLIEKNGMTEHVTFTGSLSAEQMRDAFLSTRVHAVLSVLENSPNALAESMLLGVPCLASSAGGIPSMLEDRTEGLLFPPGDLKALTAGITTLFDDDALCGRLSENAARRAERLFDGDANYARLVEIYRTVAGEEA